MRLVGAVRIRAVGCYCRLPISGRVAGAYACGGAEFDHISTKWCARLLCHRCASPAPERIPQTLCSPVWVRKPGTRAQKVVQEGGWRGRAASWDLWEDCSARALAARLLCGVVNRVGQCSRAAVSAWSSAPSYGATSQRLSVSVRTGHESIALVRRAASAGA